MDRTEQIANPSPDTASQQWGDLTLDTGSTTSNVLNLSPPRSLTTENLILRVPEISDAEAMYSRWTSKIEVAKYLPWVPHESSADTAEFIQRCRSRWDSGGPVFTYVVTQKTPNAKPWGTVDIIASDLIEGASLGFCFSQEVWGKGIAREAVSTLLEYLKSQPQVPRVFAECHDENIFSARLLETIGLDFRAQIPFHFLTPNLNGKRDARVYDWRRAESSTPTANE